MNPDKTNEPYKELIEWIKVLSNSIKGLSTISTQPSNELEHFTIEEIAGLLHCSVNSIRNIIKEDQIKIFRYKGTIRIRKTHLERFINRNTS